MKKKNMMLLYIGLLDVCFGRGKFRLGQGNPIQNYILIGLYE
jgi:hypothetical protein